MQPDYPAAHSMDTCFFAIDRDGHVACFDSGEAGAVPVQAVTGPPDTVERQLAALPRCEVLYDPRGHTLPGSRQQLLGHRSLWGVPVPVLMFLKALDPVQEEMAAGLAVQVPASEGVAVLFRTLSEERAKQLHDSGACLGCDWHFEEADDEENVADWTTRGFFRYGHLTENWISGPYGRERCPVQPLHIDRLPPQLREAIQAMRFDSLCFAEAAHIQPVEHAPCESWEAAYVDAQYTIIRPIPGKESEYASWYKERGDSYKDLRIEPPPGKATNPNEE